MALLSETFTEKTTGEGETPITRTLQLREAGNEYILEARTEWPEDLGGCREWEVLDVYGDRRKAVNGYANEFIVMSVNFQMS